MGVKFLPPNIKFLIRPMDKQVIANFKGLHTMEVLHKRLEATSGDGGITLIKFWKMKFNILKALKSIVAAWQLCCLNAA
jgi:hypothetical protein